MWLVIFVLTDAAGMGGVAKSREPEGGGHERRHGSAGQDGEAGSMQSTSSISAREKDGRNIDGALDLIQLQWAFIEKAVEIAIDK